MSSDDTDEDIDRTLAELLAAGDVVRRWDPARGWVYHAQIGGMTPPPAPAEDLPPAAFCDDCAARAASSIELVRALLVMAVETAALHANARDLLWDLAVPDIDLLKQLRLMFTASPAPARARAALDLLAKAGVRPH